MKTYTEEEVGAAIAKHLMEVSELFGGYAARDAKATLDTDSAQHKAWLEGRGAGYNLVKSHCQRVADIYKGDK